MRNEADGRERLAYEKPKLLVIELAAEEVLISGCKTAMLAPGKSGGTCSMPACSVAPYGS